MSAQPRLRRLNDLVGADDLLLPPALVLAISADRPELLSLAKGVNHDPDRLIDLIGVLMRTNRALRDHCTALTSEIKHLTKATDAMNKALGDANRFRMEAGVIARNMQAIANFDDGLEDEDED